MNGGPLLSFSILVIGVAITSAVDYNFNSSQFCKKSGFVKTISSNDRATVIFREKTKFYPLDNVPDTCYMTFNAPLLSSKHLQVKFDSTERNISDSIATIIFYDSDEVKLSKKLREYSKNKPIKLGDTITTTEKSLTIAVSRDVKKSKNFNVVMTVMPVSSATGVAWSLSLMSLPGLVLVLSGAIYF